MSEPTETPMGETRVGEVPAHRSPNITVRYCIYRTDTAEFLASAGISGYRWVSDPTMAILWTDPVIAGKARERYAAGIAHASVQRWDIVT